jgi:hypothetical protein
MRQGVAATSRDEAAELNRQFVELPSHHWTGYRRTPPGGHAR